MSETEIATGHSPALSRMSSGIPQFVDHSGRVIRSGIFPGAEEAIVDPLTLFGAGALPRDRRLAQVSGGLTINRHSGGMVFGWPSTQEHASAKFA